MPADLKIQARTLAYSHASSRFAKTWTNDTITWPDLLARLAQTHRTAETVDQYAAMKRSEQDQIKDVGGFVAGHLKEGRRKKGHVHARSMLTLDADFGTLDLWDEITLLHPWAAAVYSTHKHTPAKPRLRLVIPLARDVTEDEYPAVARKIADQLGIDAFDDTTYEPARLMYWPSTSIDGEYVFDHQDGPLLDPDAVLASYTDWTDVSTWPVSSRQTRAIRARADKQADPLTKNGIVGAFCRTYTIQDAIDTFLPTVYAPSTVEGRYDYIPGESSSGVVIYDDRFSFSHHGTDPAGGRLLNAFDLVRIHLYGDLDEDADEQTPVNRLPSYKAMGDHAASDKQVKTLLATERLETARDDFQNLDSADWMTKLDVTRQGAYADTLHNHVLIAKNDPDLAGIAFNLHRDGIDVRGDTLPWEQVKPGWTESDNAQLKAYIQETYGLYSPSKTKDAVLVAAADRAYHPVRDWFAGLPEWDGRPRLDTLLVDYLGAEDTLYTRTVTRKTIIAAVARIYRPGTKFDSILILNGPQGIGKSTVFARLGGDWFTDALTLTDMRDKTAAEKLQGFMIAELGELAGMRKTEVETVKSFVSRQDDKYRAAYGVSVESHPRQCIIVGSTNAESGFLRDITGNRRFWPVHVPGSADKKPWQLSEADVEQVWAEALVGYRHGEDLFLTGEAARTASAKQSEAMETDEREGLVAEYLERRIPRDWYELDTHERRGYLNGTEFGERQHRDEDLVDREIVSNIEIWAECFGKDPVMLDRMNSYQISSIMQRMPGWEKSDRLYRIPPYNRQRVYIRKGAEA